MKGFRKCDITEALLHSPSLATIFILASWTTNLLCTTLVLIVSHNTVLSHELIQDKYRCSHVINIGMNFFKMVAFKIFRTTSTASLLRYLFHL